MSTKPPTVLFLCADNSVRSQLAEALLRHRAGDRYVACSAGLRPAAPHPLVAEVLREIGIDIQPEGSHPIGTFLGGRSVRHAVILRSADETQAPRIFPFATRTECWDVGDPMVPAESDGDLHERFRRVRDDIDARIFVWLAADDASARRTSAA
jgi:protein-tyrosine-phosphatase